MLAVLLACLSMGVKDGIGVLLTVAEARGRAMLAAQLAAASDLASIACYVLGAGEVIKHGIDPHAIVVIGGMICTSFLGTLYWTGVSRRIRSEATV